MKAPLLFRRVQTKVDVFPRTLSKFIKGGIIFPDSMMPLAAGRMDV